MDVLYVAGEPRVPRSGGIAQPAFQHGVAAETRRILDGAKRARRADRVQAPVSFAGLASGYVGLYQVNVQVPQGVAAGDSVPVVLPSARPFRIV
ncbi:MAG TPA: hypothetical protein VMH05_13055 [Bryobacteraceae bacterium]|nr:hypothetical protein [Bryobacteraceae bacterium]